MIDETFLTTEEVLEYLQVNLRTVYRLIKAGKIPAVRVGRQWRFRKRDIDTWLDSQRPRDGARVSPAMPARQAPTGSTRPRVLVVDDEASIRDLLAKTLALAEYDVDVVTDGRSALERVRAMPGVADAAATCCAPLQAGQFRHRRGDYRLAQRNRRHCEPVHRKRRNRTFSDGHHTLAARRWPANTENRA